MQINATQREAFLVKKEELVDIFVYDRHQSITVGEGDNAKERVRIDGTINGKGVCYYVSPKFRLPNLVNGQTYKISFIEVKGEGKHEGKTFLNPVAISNVLTTLQRDLIVTGAAIATPVAE